MERDEPIDLEDEQPIKWYKLCENPEKEMEKICRHQEMGMKY